MTLEVETGSASATSESYASVAEADAYLSARGATAWVALQDEAKEQALRRATDYMVQTYRTRWKGFRVKPTQSLDWPRYDVQQPDAVGPDGYGGVPFYAPDTVPREVRYACMELAVRATAGDLLDDLDPLVLSESVGPISTSYAPGASRHRTFPAVDRLLQPMLIGGGSGVKLVRA